MKITKKNIYLFHFRFVMDQYFRKTVYPELEAIGQQLSEYQLEDIQSSAMLHLSQMCSDHMDILCKNEKIKKNEC